jgi:hypothetical protein
MSTTIAEAPPAENKPSPFHAALENAFKGEDAPPVETKKDEAPPAEAAKAEAETKKSTRDDLFKKPEAKEAEAAITEKPVVDEIAEPPKLDAKGKAGWEALKKINREKDQALTQLQKQMEEWKVSGRDPETLEKHLAERDKRIADYEERVSRVDLELTDSFKREITEPRQKEMGKAKALAEEMEVSPDEMSSALNLRGKARSAALREIGIDPDGGRISRIMDNLDELHDRAESERANAKQSLDQRKEQERMEQAAAHSEQVKRQFLNFEETTRRMKASLEILNRVDGDDDWNTKSKSVVEGAKAYMEANPYADAEAVLEAKAMPVYRALFLEEREKVATKNALIADMEKELKAIHGRSPSLTQRGAAATTGNPKPFSSMIAEAFGQ